MSSSFKKKAVDLKKELIRDIRELEAELHEKKSLLDNLERIEVKKRGVYGRGRPRGRTAGTKSARVAGPVQGGRRKPVRRKSKHRDTIINAARKMKGRFTLAELKEKIFEKDPKFGGNYPSGTILAALKSTPEIKRLKRGVYRYKG